MGSTTISLERSAYELLKEAKLPGESFSETVRRLTQEPDRSLRKLIGLFNRADADAMAELINGWRAKDQKTRIDLGVRPQRRNAARARQ